MKRFYIVAAALALASLPAAPALAAWKLMTHGQTVKVAKGTLAVTPTVDWNKGGGRPIPKSEIWTLDGVGLNQLYFVSGLIAGETLYRDKQKKEQPLPKFASSMQLTDIPEFYESSARLSLGTSMFRITGTEPVTFGGKQGVKFSFEYAVEGSALIFKGMASGTIDAGKLQFISFTAPATFYWDRDRAKAEAVMASATF